MKPESNKCEGGSVESAVWGVAANAIRNKRCEEEHQLVKQIESLFLLKELPSSPECSPCGAEKQPSALRR